MLGRLDALKTSLSAVEWKQLIDDKKPRDALSSMFLTLKEKFDEAFPTKNKKQNKSNAKNGQGKVVVYPEIGKQNLLYIF